MVRSNPYGLTVFGRVMGVLVALMTVTYLTFEYAFNAHLLNTVSGEASSHAINQLEMYGRILASIGLFMTFVHIAYHTHFKNVRGTGDRDRRGRGGYKWLWIGLSFAIALFIGEKIFIDKAVDMFSPSQQSDAYAAGLLREGMAMKVVSIRGMSFGNNSELTPSEMTLLAMIGFAEFSSSKLTEEVVKHFAQIAKAISESKIGSNGDQMYRQYVDAWNDFAKRYKNEYLPASREYTSSGGASTHQRAEKEWVAINQKLLAEGWPQYERINSRFDSSVQEKAKKLQPKLQEFVKRREACHGWSSCIKRVDRHYVETAQRYFGHDAPEWTYWCDQLSKSALSIPIISNLPGGHDLRINIGPKEKTNHYTCDESLKNVTKRLRPLMARRFEEQKGFPVGIPNRSAFLASSASTYFLKNASQKMGIELPGNWRSSDKLTWVQAAADAVKNGAHSHWARMITRQLGTYVAPGLSWDEFVRSKGVRDLIVKQTGSWVKPGLTAEQFSQQAITHLIHKGASKVARTYTSIRMGREQEIGRNAVLAMIVPPIALALSLLFSLINSLALVIDTGVGLVQFVVESTGKLLNQNLISRIRLAMKIIAWGAVISVPTQFSNPVSNSPAFGVLQNQIDESSGPITKSSIDWLIRAEPAFYGIGQKALSIIEKGYVSANEPVHLPGTGAPWAVVNKNKV